MTYLEFLQNHIRSEKVQNARAKRSVIRKLRDALDGVCFSAEQPR